MTSLTCCPIPFADDYIMNLKGQVYLLTIENEMMKKSMISEAGPQQQQQQSMMYQQHLGHQPGLATLSPQHQLGSASMPRPRDAAPPTMHSMNASSILLASDLPAASYPTEINDAFEVMRQKYAQLDHKYQHDVDEARRAAEALASQCAAQSSLITTLKKEVEAANENLSEQKNIAQAVDQRSAVDLEKATNDIGQLQGRIQELSETLEIRDRKTEDMYHEVAKLKSDRVLAEGEREGADRARAKALVQLGLQNGICKVLVRKWQEAKMTINHLAADLQKVGWVTLYSAAPLACHFCYPFHCSATCHCSALRTAALLPVLRSDLMPTAQVHPVILPPCRSKPTRMHCKGAWIGPNLRRLRRLPQLMQQSRSVTRRSSVLRLCRCSSMKSALRRHG